jgi:preprotein translocase subunit SecF
MHFLKSPNIDFIGKYQKAFIVSGVLLCASVISIIAHGGLNMSIDFVGGTLVQCKFEKPVRDDLSDIRGIITGLQLGQPEIKTVGPADQHQVQIVVKKKAEGTVVGDKIKEALATQYTQNPFEVQRIEKVGAKIGGELQRNAFLAIGLSLIAIVIYVGFRFHFPFGIASIVALFHDVVITIGVFSITNAEFSLPIIAALLTIVGYSLNDTIVVFDRIRENLGGSLVRKEFPTRVNTSINECLSRTVITSLTTFLVVLALFIAFFNSGNVIKHFSMALLVGVVVGTYSSAFVASPVLVLWNKKWPMK